MELDKNLKQSWTENGSGFFLSANKKVVELVEALVDERGPGKDGQEG